MKVSLSPASILSSLWLPRSQPPDPKRMICSPFLFVPDMSSNIILDQSDVESITIHLGISHKETIRIGIPILDDKGLESVASLHFGNAPFFAFVEIAKGQITSVSTKINNAAKMASKKERNVLRSVFGRGESRRYYCGRLRRGPIPPAERSSRADILSSRIN